MGRNNRHVVPTSDGRWAVRREGSSRASVVVDTQRQAIDRGRDFTRNTGGGEVVTHGRNNLIRDSDTIAPASDPFPPRDAR